MEPEERQEKPADDRPTSPETRTSDGDFVDRFMDDVVPDVHPKEVGPYKILSRLGEGGMGIVYLAEQTVPVRRQVALKLIKLGMDTREVVARFEAERQALAMMSHPHIASVYDAGATPRGRPYFVMEYVPGVPITEYCDQNGLNLRQRLELFISVCEGIQHAHQKAVIHRDLKPSNVIVTVVSDKAIPKIIDFGIAKATNQRLTEKTLYTEVGQMVGTPAYMSPEETGVSGLDVDTRTDIYSLGVLLYELLVGALPFDTESLRAAGYLEIQRIIREDEPPKPSTKLSALGQRDSGPRAQARQTDVRSLGKQLRGDLDAITMKALAKNRIERYATVFELGADIERHLNHEPVLAEPPSLSYRLRKFARKRRVPLSVGAGVLVLVAIVSIAVHLQSQRNFREEQRSQSRILFQEGKFHDAGYQASTRNVENLRQQHQAARYSIDTWRPIWDRGEEVKQWEQVVAAEKQAKLHYVQALES